MRYELLNQQHDDYALDVWTELDELYEGGYRVEKNAARYLERQVNEGAKRYDARLRSCAYLNYMGPIVDSFVESTFEKSLVMTPPADATDPTTEGGETEGDYWQDFAKNCDRMGTDFATLMRRTLTTALLMRRAYVQIDLPNVGDAAPQSALEEEELGANNAYAFERAPSELINWKRSDSGSFDWAITKTTRKERLDPADKMRTVEEFMVWRMSGGFASWEKFEVDVSDKKKIEPTKDIPIASNGITSFKIIPIFMLELPKGLHVGNKIGPPQKEHFQRRSSLIAAQNKSLYAIPYVTLGPEIGGPQQPIPSGTDDPNRGNDPVQQYKDNGFVVLGTGDTMGFAEPGGGAYSLVNDQLGQLVDEIHRISQQMAASVSATSTALGRSGASKQEDRSATGKILCALGFYVREFAVSIYRFIDTLRGDDTKWEAKGLDVFETEDRALVLQESTAAKEIFIPSVAFMKAYLLRLAVSLLGDPSHEMRKTIQDELDASVTADTIQQLFAAQIAKVGPPPAPEGMLP